MSEFRFMRIIVFFDLPVVSKEEKRAYVRFRKFLIEDGYDMIQFSVYARLVNGEDAVDKHYLRMQKNLPPEGSIRFLQVTERQYSAMKLLLGKKTVKEKKVGAQLTLMF